MPIKRFAQSFIKMLRALLPGQKFSMIVKYDDNYHHLLFTVSAEDRELLKIFRSPEKAIEIIDVRALSEQFDEADLIRRVKALNKHSRSRTNSPRQQARKPQ